jgi:hypothetical protein
MAEDSKLLEKFNDFIKGSIDSGKKVADMNYRVSDAGKDLNAVFSNMGVVGKMAGAVIGDMAKYAQESVTAWQGVSKFGLSFGNDAIGLRTAAAQTRMSFDDYNKFIGNNKDVLSSWGGSMTEGAKKFNALSDAYATSTMTIDGVTVSTADKMEKMGITTEEMNDVLALTMTSQRMVNKDSKEGQRAAIESATQLAMEMDKMAKLTGMSREEQMKGLKEKQLDVQYQAQTRLLMAGLTEEQKKEMSGAIKAYQNTATRLGGSTAAAMKEIATGGIRSKEAADAMSRLGPAGAELQKAFQAVRDAKTPELKQAAELQLARAEEAVLRVQQSKAFQQQVARGDEASVKLAQASQKQQMSLEAVAAANDKRGALDLSTAEGFAQAKKEQAALALKEQTTDTAGTTEAVVLFNQRAKDAGAVINKVFVEDLNNTVGKALQSKTAGQAIGLKGSINDQMAGQRPDGKSFTDKFTEGAENTKQKVKDKVVQGADVLKDLQNSKIGQIASVTLEKLGSVVEGNYMKVKNILGIGDTRDTGTLGMTGKLFEPQDFFGKVQKGETVLTPEQLQNLVRGTMATASEKMSGSPDKLRSMMETKFAAMGNEKTSKAPSMAQITGGMMDKGSLEQLARSGMPPPQPTTNVTEDTESMETRLGGDSSLSEVVDELVQLNKNIGNLIGLTQDSLENTGRQIKATKGLSGNLFA